MSAVVAHNDHFALPLIQQRRLTLFDVILHSLPPAVLFSVSLVLSNWAYIYCPVGLLAILKSASPAAIYIAALLFGLRSFSFKIMIIILLICLGVAMASYSKTSVNWIGVTIQMVAIAVEATRVTLISILLQGKEGKKDMSPLKTLYCAYFRELFAEIWNPQADRVSFYSLCSRLSSDERVAHSPAGRFRSVGSSEKTRTVYHHQQCHARVWFEHCSRHAHRNFIHGSVLEQSHVGPNLTRRCVAIGLY